MTTIACTLDEGDRGSRALVGIETTRRGLRLAFVAGPGVGPELLELAELERDCCAFATWTVRSEEGRIVLDVAADGDDAVPVVQGMFGPLRELPPHS
jgi:hypothetical protein